MKGGLRQSNAWLHGWAGLLLGWLMFAIFLTGTISFFRQEVTYWMQPELHRAAPAADGLEKGLAKLAAVAPEARTWTISLPSERNNAMRLSWSSGRGGRRDQVSEVSPDRLAAEAAAEKANARGGRPRQPTITLDPATGAVLAPRDTAGGEFLYRFHYQLHAMPRGWGRWIVGVATSAMFVALISGVITHKKIFREFFTFRPNKGQRSWLDLHNAVAVLSLPFHVMITFSGLLLLGGTLLPWGAQQLSGGGQRERPAEVERSRGGGGPLDAASPAQIAQVIVNAEAIWGQPVGRVTIQRRGGSAGQVEVTPQRADGLLLRPGGGPARSLTFKASTGELVKRADHLAANPVEGVDRVFAGLHLARFASTGLRWLFFVAGVMGTVMVGTGLVLWAVKRAEKRRGAPAPLGARIVDHLNIGAVAGLMVAVGAYFWINRIAPAQMDGRPDVEIAGFFVVWGLTFLHPLVRPVYRAWIEQIALGGVLFAALPLLNGLTGGMSLLQSVPAGAWLVAGFDLVSLLTGGAMLIAAYKLSVRQGSQPRTKPARKLTQVVAGAE